MLAEEQKQESGRQSRDEEMAIFVASVFSFLTFMCRILSFPRPLALFRDPRLRFLRAYYAGPLCGKCVFP